ncbi:hypothetical protein PP635_gp35 [Arthrobacter phage Auxilium]|jgi:hypothetical protein|uniref:Uncharacterized protein n=2 Tax=Richievirus TaxID=3044803 RepID=A0A3G2KIP1_9CAUD|nr:hypothetical protein PP634_gp37 [Arthrobacter phage Richie]YP_010655854.1 hypothetical protein PP635_gp35 [Arthrobacter phage Auxilium]UVF61000.1 membrane protein [Arthrobacter phage Gorpy]UVK61984.1 membrane protein [Arthrobacter phage Sakai]AYN55814.1 hypothetical protein PBI_AUXILIUM_35 [Arthrobacter phage Auxilium]AYN58863.1 hypothetical protein PBI_RICHIE_37 [Arthrobacter phage Richie]
MDWAGFLQWITNQGLALVVAAVAAWISYRAIRTTRAYQDPVFVMECEPVDWQAYPPGGIKEQVPMVLVNKGNSHAKDVTWSADFDPFHLHAPEQSWPLVEGNGGRVAVMSLFRADGHGAGVLSSLVQRTDGARQCTVTCTSQAGHRFSQKVNLPNPYEYQAQPQTTAAE